MFHSKMYIFTVDHNFVQYINNCVIGGNQTTLCLKNVPTFELSVTLKMGTFLRHSVV